MKKINSEVINNFFLLLNENNINYILIKNIDNELPNNLIDGKDIDILVHLDSKEEFENIMKENNYNILTHPQGNENGWNFGYNMPSCQFWKKNDNSFTLYIDVNFILCCKSLINKTWVPLNEPINNSIWQNKIFDKNNNWWIMDDKNLLLYLIVRCIFDKSNFSDSYIKEIEIRKHYINEIKDKLEITFFKFNSHLQQLIKDSNYNKIINDYITYNKY